MDALTGLWEYISSNQELVIEQTIAHLRITVTAVGLATISAVLLAVLVYRFSLPRSIALSAAAIVLTVPSLALFAIFIPIVGTGNTPAILALFLYGQLPILRNTVTGLTGVSPAVVESAKGMGMNPFQLLLRIRLPLAMPLILAGVRITTLLTVGIAAIAVLVGGDGLGYFIRLGIIQQGFPFADNAIYTGIIFTILLGLLLDGVLRVTQRIVTPRGIQA